MYKRPEFKFVYNSTAKTKINKKKKWLIAISQFFPKVGLTKERGFWWIWDLLSRLESRGVETFLV